MYDPLTVLQALDQNKYSVIALCGLAMIFNYIWFVLAVVKGFRDRVYPIPIFSTLFWLCGDGSGVLSYDLYFNVYHHWYLELFWIALIFTVSFEILFIWMTFKFGKDELSLGENRLVFPASLVAAAVIFVTSWAYLRPILNDDLNIIYFNLANMAGPIAYAGLLARRRSTAGTSSWIWIFYTLMLTSWYAAQALYFGPEFRSPQMLAFFAVNIVSAALLAAYVRSMEARDAEGTAGRSEAAGRVAALQP